MGIVFSNTSATDMDASYQYGGKNYQKAEKIQIVHMLNSIELKK